MTVADEWVVDWRCKSFPPSADGVPASRIADAGWRVPDDFATPVAVLSEPALTHNLIRMRRFCAEHDVQIAPHGKTTMSPELIARQLEHGAWGITVATAWQARAMLEFGVRRVLIANECVDPIGLGWLASYLDDHPEIDVYAFVDSPATVDTMREILREAGASRPVPVLVEVGVAGGRAGARTVDTAVAVGQAVAQAAELELAGVAGFEGVIGGRRVPEVVEPVRVFLETIRQCAQRLMDVEAFRQNQPVILSAGGTAFFDQVVDVFTTDRGKYQAPVEVVIRSGCYVTHDDVTYRASSPFAGDGEGEFQPALRVCSRVVSMPEPGLATVDAGKRDVSTDGQMPVVRGRFRDGGYADAAAVPGLADVVVDHFNDQHGYLHTGDAADVLRVGDVVVLGISHPCTTFDKWRAIPVMGDDYRVLSAVRTFF